MAIAESSSKRKSWNQPQSVILWWIVRALEHVEHTAGDVETTNNVDGCHSHRSRGQCLGSIRWVVSTTCKETVFRILLWSRICQKTAQTDCNGLCGRQDIPMKHIPPTTTKPEMALVTLMRGECRAGLTFHTNWYPESEHRWISRVHNDDSFVRLVTLCPRCMLNRHLISLCQS